MRIEVKPVRRVYRSARRAAQAARTRHDIVAAPCRLFRERGYEVPMSSIADEAGVAVETVYRVFGTKAALFHAAIDTLLAGGIARADVAVGDRPAIRAIRAETDPRRQVQAYAATQPGIHRRAGPVLRALRDARAGDPELAALWQELELRRLEGQTTFVAYLARQGALREGLSVERGADALWALCALAVRDLLVLERGWTDDDYREWLAAMIEATLLSPAGHVPLPSP